MPRAEVVIGFAPEDRELIQRMLDQQDEDSSSERLQALLDRALERADGYRQAASATQDQSTRYAQTARQVKLLLDTARDVAASALASDQATITDLRDALYSITKL